MSIKFMHFTALQGSFFFAFAAVAAPEFLAPVEFADDLVAAEEDAEDFELAAEADANPDLAWIEAEGLGERNHEGGHKPPGQAPECAKDKGQDHPNCPGPR